MIRGWRILISFRSRLLLCIRGLRRFGYKGCQWIHWYYWCWVIVYYTAIPTATITAIPQSIAIVISTTSTATATATATMNATVTKVLFTVVTSITTVVRHGLYTCVCVCVVSARSTICSPPPVSIIVPFRCPDLCSDREIKDIEGWLAGEKQHRLLTFFCHFVFNVLRLLSSD